MVVIRARGNGLLEMLHRRLNSPKPGGSCLHSSPDPQPTQAGGLQTGGPITGGPWASVGLVWRRSRTCLDLNPDSVTYLM